MAKTIAEISPSRDSIVVNPGIQDRSIPRAWRNQSIGRGGPLAYSSKTRGSTFNWDDTAASPSIPQSGKGEGKN